MLRERLNSGLGNSQPRNYGRMSAIRTFNVEAGLPTLDEARWLVIEEIKQAKRAGARVITSF